MSRKFYKDTDSGKWESDFAVAPTDVFGSAMLEYLNVLDPFFSKAQEKCEFEFILCLLRFTGMRDAGWDPFENLLDVYEGFQRIHATNIEDELKAHYALFMYGLILEASAPYEMLANLMNVIEGNRYSIQNFKDYKDSVTGRIRSLSPADKAAQLKSRAKKLRLSLALFDEFSDNALRNGIFHSDYSIYWPEIRIRNPDKRYSHQEWMGLVNRSFAYLSALEHLYYGFVRTYSEPELIEPHPEFKHHQDEKVTTIVRQGYGLVGIKDNWTKEQVVAGFIPYRVGLFLPYEIPLVEQGILKLPSNKIEKFNKRIKYLPRIFKEVCCKEVCWELRC